MVILCRLSVDGGKLHNIRYFFRPSPLSCVFLTPSLPLLIQHPTNELMECELRRDYCKEQFECLLKAN